MLTTQRKMHELIKSLLLDLTAKRARIEDAHHYLRLERIYLRLYDVFYDLYGVEACQRITNELKDENHIIMEAIENADKHI